MGVVPLKHIPTDEENAYHEAGHAVIAYLKGATVIEITIVPDLTSELGSYGRTSFKHPSESSIPLDPSSNRAYNQLVQAKSMTYLAGPNSERVFFEHRSLNVPQHLLNLNSKHPDARQACLEIQKLGRSDEKKLLEDHDSKVKQLLKDHWEAVKSVANALLEYKTLDTQEADGVLAKALPAKAKQRKKSRSLS